ncbi:Protein unc-45-like protein, partial [Leptotrombidium deliense]
MESKFDEIKEKGNCFFKKEDYNKSVECYLECLKCGENINEENRLAIYKNLSAAHLKLKDFSEALKYASKAIEINPKDVKALFRRMQAFEALNMNSEAFKDAILIKKLEPKNKAVESSLQKLSALVQKSSNEQSSVEYKVKSMIEILTSENCSTEKLEVAAGNLLVLSKERAGTELIMKYNGIEGIRGLLNSSTNSEIRLTLMRVISELCKHKPDWTISILKKIELDFLLILLGKYGKNSEEFLTAAQYTIQSIINTFTGFNPKDNIKPDIELMEKYEKQIDFIMETLVRSSSSRTIAGCVRDSILELISRNVDFEALNWGKKLLDKDCLRHLLDIS